MNSQLFCSKNQTDTITVWYSSHVNIAYDVTTRQGPSGHSLIKVKGGPTLRFLPESGTAVKKAT